MDKDIYEKRFTFRMVVHDLPVLRKYIIIDEAVYLDGVSYCARIIQPDF